MEKQFEKLGPILDERGRPIPGYSTRNRMTYDRRAVRRPPWRLKEWDFYQISDGSVVLQLTIGHAGYAGQINAMLFNIEKKKWLTEKNRLLMFPLLQLSMPANGDEDHILAYEKKGVSIRFETKADRRRLTCQWDDFEADITLTRLTPHALVHNIPFSESPYCFFFTEKANCMTAEGAVRWGSEQHLFHPASSFGILDWGRGVWPFHHEWYWSNGTGYIDGQIFGFNLGDGFGDTSAASQNMLFYGDTAHKIGEVRFLLGSDYMQPWRFRDEEGRLDLTLTPIYDRTTRTKMLWIDNCCHQIFGQFSGTAVLDDGRRITIEDMTAFSEHAVNNW